MKIEWLVTDVTVVGSSARARHDMFSDDFGFFWTIQATFVVGEPLCDVGNPCLGLSNFA